MSNFTKNILLNVWTATIQDIIEEVKEYEFENMTNDDIYEHFANGDFNERVDQLLWEALDGCEEVIYTYQAKQVCEALKVDIFDTCEMTGERFASWSEAAFSGIYTMIQEEISINDMIDETIKNA